jgi:hypothetical protein
MDKINVALYLDSSETILEVCREVIDKLDVRGPGSELAEREAQLKEISRAIDKLENAGIGVPDELRSLKINLVAELAVSDEINRFLEDLADGFEEILQDLCKRTGRIYDKEVRKKSLKPRSKEPKTSHGVLRQNILEALATLGSSGRLQQVLDEMEKQLNGKLLPGDLVKRTSGQIAWKNNACWERFKMVQDGILKNDTPHGIWELSEEYK